VTTRLGTYVAAINAVMAHGPFINIATACMAVADAELAAADLDTSRFIDQLTEERDEALATIARVRALHVIDKDFDVRRPWCASDKMLWPCPTCVALDGPPT
jgi:hypothetical protein